MWPICFFQANLWRPWLKRISPPLTPDLCVVFAAKCCPTNIISKRTFETNISIAMSNIVVRPARGFTAPETPCRFTSAQPTESSKGWTWTFVSFEIQRFNFLSEQFQYLALWFQKLLKPSWMQIPHPLITDSSAVCVAKFYAAELRWESMYVTNIIRVRSTSVQRALVFMVLGTPWPNTLVPITKSLGALR